MDDWFVRKHSQVESLAGAAHLLNDNAGVTGELKKNRNLMWTTRGKACLILISVRSEEYSARGVRKVTTGKTCFMG